MQHFLADDGEAIHYKASGEGPPLVLLHGWTSTHRDWNPFLANFEARHRVFRWDARGHGGHRLRTNTLPSVARMAGDLQQLLEQHGLSDAVVVGQVLSREPHPDADRLSLCQVDLGDGLRQLGSGRAGQKVNQALLR